MALEVEDGTAKANADSYVSITAADTYWSDRNNETWADAETAEKEAALREATEFLDNAYSWKGYPVSPSTQALQWPRYNATDRHGFDITSTTIPQEIITATIRLAYSQLSGDLLADEDNSARVRRSREKVDVIETETEYFDGTTTRRRYPTVERLVSGLTIAASGGIVGYRERA